MPEIVDVTDEPQEVVGSIKTISDNNTNEIVSDKDIYECSPEKKKAVTDSAVVVNTSENPSSDTPAADDDKGPETQATERIIAIPQRVEETIKQFADKDEECVAALTEMLNNETKECEKLEWKIAECQKEEATLKENSNRAKNEYVMIEKQKDAMQKLCKELRKQTDIHNAASESLVKDETVKRKEIEESIEQQILPLKQAEQQSYEKDIKEQLDLKEKLEKVIFEYEMRERITKEVEDSKNAEFEKFEKKIVEIIALTKEDGERLAGMRERNDLIKDRNTRKETRIRDTLEGIRESQASCTAIHDNIDAMKEEENKLRLNVGELRKDKADFERRELEFENLKKRKKELERKNKLMNHEIEDD